MAKYEMKTKVEPQSVEEFIDAIQSPQRQAEARELLAIHSEASGYPARLFTGGMIGIGCYSSTYASGHSGSIFATGFAPRKAELSLYGLTGGVGADEGAGVSLADLGKHRAVVACVYVKHLKTIDKAVHAGLIRQGLAQTKSRYPVTAE
jgi:hypothetical protein